MIAPAHSCSQCRLAARLDAVLVGPAIRALLANSLVDAVGVVPGCQYARDPLVRVNGVDEPRIQLDTAAGPLRSSHDRTLRTMPNARKRQCGSDFHSTTHAIERTTRASVQNGRVRGVGEREASDG